MSTSPQSFLPYAWNEILRHKWIESEKAGRDLGQSAVDDWIRRYWSRFCRQRRFEHLEGTCHWREFPKEEFGILWNVAVERTLLEEIVRRLKSDQDHLEILLWLTETHPVDVERVVEFLMLIDTNSARLPESFAQMGLFVNMDLAQLRERSANAETFEYLFFGDDRPSPDGAITPSCLSQVFQSNFTIDGITYPTAEHWMMASKARLFGDDAILKRILEIADPSQATMLGRHVANFNDAVWKANARRLVTEGNIARFGQSPSLKAFLLGTGHRILVYASPDDTTWGIGLKETDDRAKSAATWQGENLLGFALMDVRASL